MSPAPGELRGKCAPAMTLAFLEVLLLGLVQGIAEFFPISSAGHLALVQMLFGATASLATAVFLQVGTLLASVLVVRKRARNAIAEGLRGLVRPSLLKDTPGGRDAWVVFLATIPTGVVALLLRGASELCARSPILLGACFLASALAIGSTHWAPKGEKDTPPAWGSVLVGALQGAAILPGLSRSAVTLATLLWLGMTGERAFELSLLVSLPALAGEELLEARHVFHGTDSVTSPLLAAGVALVTGIGALHILRAALSRRVVAVFAFYLVPLGVATLAWGYARP
jgi:undecaprenyl-diphosphatase